VAKEYRNQAHVTFPGLFILVQTHSRPIYMRREVFRQVVSCPC